MATTPPAQHPLLCIKDLNAHLDASWEYTSGGLTWIATHDVQFSRGGSIRPTCDAVVPAKQLQRH